MRRARRPRGARLRVGASEPRGSRALTTPQTSDTGQPQKWAKLQQWAYTILAVVLMLIGAMKIYNVFFPSLPGCASDSTRETLGDIFKQKNLALTTLTNQRMLTDGKSEKTCQADFKTATESGTLTYRIYWQDKNAQIQITEVH
jgi:hypothetical protein